MVGVFKNKDTSIDTTLKIILPSGVIILAEGRGVNIPVWQRPKCSNTSFSVLHKGGNSF